MSIAYQVVPEHAFGYNRTKRIWEKVNVNEAVPVLLNTYHLMEIGVTALGLEHTFYPQLHLAELANQTGTLQDWFTANAGVAIPELGEGYPSLKFAHMHFQSLYADFRAKAHLVPPGYHFSQDFSLDDAHDVVIEVDPEAQMTYATGALYFIDGQCVPHSLDDAGVRLHGAGKIARRAAKSNVSCMVFKDIGAVTTHPLKNLVLERLDTSRDWYSTVLVRTPRGLTGQTAAVVIGGIVHWVSPRDYLNETTLRISLPNYRLAHTLLALRDYYDWDDLNVGDFTTATSVAKLRDSETFHDLLKHESSFLVLIDNPYLEFESIPIDHAAADGVFYLKQPDDPDAKQQLGPLINSNGKLVDYWPTFEEGRWTLETLAFPTQALTFDEARWHRQRTVNDAGTLLGTEWVAPHVEMLRIQARVK